MLSAKLLTVARGVSYDADAVTLFAAMSVQPNATRKQLISNTIAALKTAGIWDELDRLWMMAAHTEQAGLLDWKGVGNLLAVNSPGFVADIGFAGNGSTSYLDTQFVPSEDGVQYTQNDASFGVYSRTSSTTSAVDMGAVTSGAVANTLLSIRLANSTMLWRINNVGISASGSNPGSLGLFAVRRTASNARQIYGNGAELAADASASNGLTDRALYICCYNNEGTAASFATRRYAFAFVGASLSVQQQADLYTIVTTYLAGMGTIAISSPSSYWVFQRDGSDQGDIAISGTYVGIPTAIEARFNGGSWATIDASPSGGTYSGTLSNQAAGQGALEVRYTNLPEVTASVTLVGIGDIFVIAGQSNAEGYGPNLQSYSHATLKASKYTTAWAELTDPTDPDGVGSIWPLLATDIMADQSVPVAFVPTGVSGSGITTWQTGQANYNAMKAKALAVGSVKCVLFWQGETDAIAAMNQATYNGHLDTFANAIAADLGVPVMPCRLQNTTISDANENAIRAAVDEAVSDNANVVAGPDLSALVTDDSYHLKSDVNLAAAAALWWAAIEAEFYL